MTSPVARRQTLETLRGFIAEDRREAAAKDCPPPIIYDLSANDNADFCVCPECRALAEREGSPAAPLLDFINAIAREIGTEYPELFIRTFAYMTVREVPKNIRPEKNVIIHIALLGYEFGRFGCRDTMTSLHTPQNQDSLSLIDNWSEAAPNLAIWDYWVLFEGDYLTPFINLETMVEDIRYYQKSKVADLFIECEYPHASSFFALKRYLGAKLMQNPALDPEPVIQEFMAGMYGAGAPFMQEYLEYLTVRQAEVTDSIGRIAPIKRAFLDMNFFIRSFALLERAAQAAEGDPSALNNIRQERVPLTYAFLLRRDELAKNGDVVSDPVPQPADVFKEDAIWMVNYRLPMDNRGYREQYLEQIDKLYERFTNTLAAGTTPLADQGAILFRYFDFRDIPPVKSVDDADALGGKAIRHGGELTPNQYPRSDNGTSIFGIYDVASGATLAKVVTPADTPQDEKYHMLEIGRVTLSDSTSYFYGCGGWEMQCPVDKLYDACTDTAGNTYDVYASIKFTGPDYVHGSTQENAISIDWLAFVPTAKTDSI